MMEELEYDLFISYSDVDSDWVEGFLLPALVLPKERIITEKAFRHSEVFRLGPPILDEFNRAVTTSRYTVLVLSPSYINDKWTTYSGQLASYASVIEQRERLIPMLRQQCTLPLNIDFRVRLDCTNEDNWEEEIDRLLSQLKLPKPEKKTIPCPYPGMSSFSESERSHFFGREDEIEELRERLRNQNFLFVIGPSGSGKSSLVSAGLIPELHIWQPGQWREKSIRPADSPIQALADALGISQAGKNISIEEYSRCVESVLADNPPAQRLLLFIDQFEELFTQASKLDQEAFIEAIKTLRQIKNCILLLAMRADFYSDLMESTLWPVTASQRLEIASLRDAKLQEAIAKPAETCDVYIEKELLVQLIADAADEPGVLPLLQETMVRLWEKRENSLLTMRSYRAMGRDNRSGLAVAVATMADKVLDKLTQSQQDIARRIFMRLVLFGEGRADTRRQQPISALYSDDDQVLVDQTLRHLTEGRLLMLSGEEKDTNKKVDIAHEALISGWPTLRNWMTERREAEQTRRRLEEKADEWERLGRGEGGRLDKVELGEVETWLDSPDAKMLGHSTRLQKLVEASREWLKRENEERENAARDRRIALASHLAARSELMQEQQPDLLELSILLAIEAMRLYHCLETDQALRRGLSQFGHRIVLLKHSDEGHAVCTAAFSRDGRYVATACDGGIVKVWDAKSGNGEQVACLKPGASVKSVAWSSDGRYIGTACDNGEANVWDWQIAEDKPILYVRHGYSVNAITFSPDDRYVATASDDGTVQVSETTNHDRVIRLEHENRRRVNSVTFSLDGQYIATASSDKTAKVWKRGSDSEQWSEEFRLQHDDGIVKAVAFSPDGNYIATTSGDYARIWERTARSQVVRLTHRGSVNAVMFSPDGQYVATASEDNTAGVWKTTSGYLLVRLAHQRLVKAVAFSPDSSLLLTASYDARIWETRSGRQLARLTHEELINSVAFSPDGNTLVTASDDGTAGIWKTTGGDQLLSLYHKDRVNAVAFSNDGAYIASACNDGFARIWDIDHGFEQCCLKHNAPVNAIVFNPTNNRYVATACADGTARLWVWDKIANKTLENGGAGCSCDIRLLKELSHRKNGGNVKRVIFSPDGNYLATAGEEDIALLWKIRSAGEAIRLGSGGVNVIVFSCKGTYVATANGDGQVQIWKTVEVWETENNTTPIFDQTHPNGSVVDIIFSPDDERTLVSTDGEGKTYVWDFASGRRQPLFELGPHDIVNAIAFNSDGRYLAIVGKGTKGGIWEADNYRQLVSLDHEDPGKAVAFSPCSEYLVTVNENTAAIWNREDGHQVASLRHRESVNAVTFSADGRYIATASDDGTAVLWLWRPEDLIAAAHSRVNRNLTVDEWRQYLPDELYPI